MRYFIPTLRVIPYKGPRSNKFVDHFGGIPWGLPESRWPACPHCAEPMIPLVQVAHHPQWMNLGREGRRLYAFQCWKAGFDASACPTGGDIGQTAILLEPEEFTNRVTQVPQTLPYWYVEAAMVSWEEKEDLVTEDLVKPWMEDREAYYRLPREIIESVHLFQKSGSVPGWWNGPMFDSIDSTWHLLLQFGDQIEMKGPMPSPEMLAARKWRYPQTFDPEGYPISDVGSEWVHKSDDSDDYALFQGNFGMGTAWILGKNLEGSSPRVQIVWDR